MIEEAIKKIKKEMEEKKSNSYIQAIGDFLLKQVEINRDAAVKIVNESKSIEKSLKEVEKIARKKAVQGCAVMSDSDVFKIVREYYQFEAIQDKILEVEVEEIKEKYEVNNQAEKNIREEDINAKDDFNVSLEDFL